MSHQSTIHDNLVQLPSCGDGHFVIFSHEPTNSVVQFIMLDDAYLIDVPFVRLSPSKKASIYSALRDFEPVNEGTMSFDTVIPTAKAAADLTVRLFEQAFGLPPDFNLTVQMECPEPKPKRRGLFRR